MSRSWPNEVVVCRFDVSQVSVDQLSSTMCRTDKPYLLLQNAFHIPAAFIHVTLYSSGQHQVGITLNKYLAHRLGANVHVRGHDMPLNHTRLAAPGH